METILEESYCAEQNIEEPEEPISKKYVEEAVNKVLRWFVKNEDEFFGDFNDILSIKSSENETVSGIKTPSAPSVTSSGDYSFDSALEKPRRRNKTPVRPITLSYSRLYDVEILNFDNLDSFFVVVKRENERRWNRLIRRLQKYKESLEPLTKISRGTLCLIPSDDTVHRAIIQNNNEKYAICLGLDNGKLYILDTTVVTIYKMTLKIRNTVEFQALNCKLSDVRMPNSPEMTKFVYDMVISKIEKPKIKVVKSKYSRFVDDRCMAMNKYEVMLLDETNELNANEEIAKCIQGRCEVNWDNY